MTHVPGYLPGTWTIDPARSIVSFRIRHLLVHKVRGTFDRFTGLIVTDQQPAASSVHVDIEPASLDTGNAHRDQGTLAKDPFDVASHPLMTYRSTGVAVDGQSWRVDGELTLRGVTRAVPLLVRETRFFPDADGRPRVRVTATSAIDRQDFGVRFPVPLDRRGVLAGNHISIDLDVEAVQ
ncbi:YceI family protein [Pseudonocardia spinosispora]|uniref:YceI family protein n=1 Tax=Pseudonocardia spinosispora TaxID=103441 RepID=UPI0003F6B58B|nr:YceI family protein [Pseudonocardia spinosispora]